MNNALLPSVKLPYSKCRGSISTRERKVEELVERFAEEATDAIKDKNIKLSSLQKIIDKILPENIDVTVSNELDKSSVGEELFAANDFFVNELNQVVGMSIELDTKTNKIPQGRIVDVIHEFRHVADMLFNPKYLSRHQLLEKHSLNNKKYYDVYENQFYIFETAETKDEIKYSFKTIKNKLKKLLRGYSTEDKLNIIQSMRDSLETERNAYSTQFKYGKILHNLGIVTDRRYYTNYATSFMFDKKIKLLKQTAFALIKRERERHAKRLAHTHQIKKARSCDKAHEK